MSGLEFINRFFFQLFFIRIFKGGKIIDGKLKVDRYGILYWIVPFTGWSKSYKWIGKNHSKVIYRKYSI